MDSFLSMVSLQTTLLVFLACGVICSRLHIITEKNQQQFTGFVLNILMPCMVFQSFRSVTPQMLGSALVALLVSFATCAISWVAGRILFARMDSARRDITRYATLINNAGFAGLPLAQQAFGDAGLLYASIYLIPIRVFMWSAGITMLSGSHTSTGKIARKLATNPNIIAVALGLVRGLAGIPLPTPLDTALSELSACVSPCSMIVVGAIIARVDPRTVIERDVLAYSVLRLVAIPLASLVLTHALGLPRDLAGTCMILAAMPAATSTALLASSYWQDAAYASKLICVSTVLSLVTAPALMLLL